MGGKEGVGWRSTFELELLPSFVLALCFGSRGEKRGGVLGSSSTKGGCIDEG